MLLARPRRRRGLRLERGLEPRPLLARLAPRRLELRPRRVDRGVPVPVRRRLVPRGVRARLHELALEPRDPRVERRARRLRGRPRLALPGLRRGERRLEPRELAVRRREPPLDARPLRLRVRERLAHPLELRAQRRARRLELTPRLLERRVGERRRRRRRLGRRQRRSQLLDLLLGRGQCAVQHGELALEPRGYLFCVCGRMLRLHSGVVRPHDDDVAARRVVGPAVERRDRARERLRGHRGDAPQVPPVAAPERPREALEEPHLVARERVHRRAPEGVERRPDEARRERVRVRHAALAVEHEEPITERPQEVLEVLAGAREALVDHLDLVEHAVDPRGVLARVLAEVVDARPEADEVAVDRLEVGVRKS
ncbi:MAG: hypothetical protein H6745_08705 [Deltaproteobacteria bacterium]|nr:hypothetical protein [Deltaproteobacteria bacterium]